MMNDFKDSDFEDKIKSEDVSVVQFSASWCMPLTTTSVTPSPVV